MKNTYRTKHRPLQKASFLSKVIDIALNGFHGSRWDLGPGWQWCADLNDRPCLSSDASMRVKVGGVLARGIQRVVRPAPWQREMLEDIRQDQLARYVVDCHAKRNDGMRLRDILMKYIARVRWRFCSALKREQRGIDAARLPNRDELRPDQHAVHDETLRCAMGRLCDQHRLVVQRLVVDGVDPDVLAKEVGATAEDLQKDLDKALLVLGSIVGVLDPAKA